MVIERTLFNTILIHVARTWERIRVTRPHQEMPIDNIASTEVIEEIAFTIYSNDVVQGFLDSNDWDYWMNTTNMMSDAYIEETAFSIISKNFI
jgi:hypothetical protein